MPPVTVVYDESSTLHKRAEKKHAKSINAICLIPPRGKLVEIIYSLNEKEALIAAVQQYRHANWNTWEYPKPEQVEFVTGNFKMWIKGHPSLFVRIQKGPANASA
jgi:hypothetical protein